MWRAYAGGLLGSVQAKQHDMQSDYIPVRLTIPIR
jgi:hypothetical protein